MIQLAHKFDTNLPASLLLTLLRSKVARKDVTNFSQKKEIIFKKYLAPYIEVWKKFLCHRKCSQKHCAALQVVERVKSF